MRRWAFLLIAGLIMGGCGGGGGSAPESPASQTPAPSQPAPVDPPATEEPTGENPSSPEEPQPPIETAALPHRLWTIDTRGVDGRRQSVAHGESEGGLLHENHPVGALAIVPQGRDLIADAEIHSNETGNTYWLDVEAPRGDLSDPASYIGTKAWMLQSQTYRKLAADASMRLKITEATLETLDYNGTQPSFATCPWAHGPNAMLRCFDGLFGQLRMDVRLVEITEGNQSNIRHQHFTGGVQLEGRPGAWRWTPILLTDSTSDINGMVPLRPALAPRSIFHRSQFDLTVFDGQSAEEPAAVLRLREPIVLNLDLSAIPVGAKFGVWTEVHAIADNRRGRESYVSGRLRDPISMDGTVIEASGVEATGPALRDEPESEEASTPSCDSTTTGSAQFSEVSYLEPEFGDAGPTVMVTRDGGDTGTLIAVLRTADGTAVADAHYRSVEQRIVFHDGDNVPRAIQIATIDNDLNDGDKTVNLRLTAEEGCPDIGTRDEAVLTIVDDEFRPVVSSYSVGGTVSGLQGSGLVIEEVVTGRRLTPGNGPFAFDYVYSSGNNYDVRIVTQPTQLAQICTLERGQGSVGDADVTDISVTCSTPPIGGGLDLAFGVAGKVTIPMVAGGRALALQSDGKILALGRRQLARFNSDGTVDQSFGTSGVIIVTFNNVGGEDARDLALQPDGRIVVAGFTRNSPTSLDYDFAAVRFEANGSRDVTFGNGGVAQVDFFGRTDQAHRVVLQSDGSILLGGHAEFFDTSDPTASPDTSFAVVRLTPAGMLDTTFGAEPPFTGTGKVNA